MTIKPLKRGRAWLPLATHAVAALRNSPTAKQILAHLRKLRGAKTNEHIMSLGLSCVQMLLHTAHSVGPLEAIPNRLIRQGLPSESVSNACETPPVHGNTTARESKAIVPKVWYL